MFMFKKINTWLKTKPSWVSILLGLLFYWIIKFIIWPYISEYFQRLFIVYEKMKKVTLLHRATLIVSFLCVVFGIYMLINSEYLISGAFLFGGYALVGMIGNFF